MIFYNRFVSLEELVQFISASDIYITPYLDSAQITSGTLAYTLGAGKAVISTPYWYAEEMLSEERGALGSNDAGRARQLEEHCPGITTTAACGDAAVPAYIGSEADCGDEWTLEDFRGAVGVWV